MGSSFTGVWYSKILSSHDGRAHGDDARQLEEGRAVVGCPNEHEPVGNVRLRGRVRGVVYYLALRPAASQFAVDPATKLGRASTA